LQETNDSRGHNRTTPSQHPWLAATSGRGSYSFASTRRPMGCRPLQNRFFLYWEENIVAEPKVFDTLKLKKNCRWQEYIPAGGRKKIHDMPTQWAEQNALAERQHWEVLTLQQVF